MSKLVELGDYVYDLKAMIGKGAFGSVYECKHKTRSDLSLCIKIIEQGLEDPKILREMNLMKDLITSSQGNPNIVKVEHVEIQKDKILIVLERCDGDLQQQLDRKKKNGETFHPVQALEIIKQIIHGYRVLFVSNIIHRDMKPANILYKGDVYKIADFGLARVIDNQQQDLTKVGTPKYAAPQLFHEPTFTNSADIYSIGIMFYELIYGTLPYKVASQQDVRRATRAIKTNPIKLDLNKQGLTMDISDLIESMLMYSEKERVTWAALFDHPLIKVDDGGNINQSKLLQVNEQSDEEEEEPPVKNQQPPPQPPVQQPLPQLPVQQPLPQPPVQQPLPQAPVQQPHQPQFTAQINITTGNTPNPQGKTDQTAHTPMGPPNFVPPTFKPVSQNPPTFVPPPYKFASQVQVPAPQAQGVFVQQQIYKNPVQVITAQQIYTVMSDQLYSIGVFHQCAFELLDKYTTIVIPVRNEIMGIKLQLYYLACSFFEHSKAQKNQVAITGTVAPNIVEAELTKQNQVKQQLDQEIRAHNLAFYHQIKPISPSFQDYSQKLLQLYQQGKQTLTYSSDKKYYLEYIQLLYILEKFDEYKLKIANVQDLYVCIQDIQRTISIEQTVRTYISQRRNC